MAKTKPTPNPEKGKTVLVRRSDGEEFYVTPDVARVIERQGGEVLAGAAAAKPDSGSKADKAALEQRDARIAQLEQERDDLTELLALVPDQVREDLQKLAVADGGRKDS